MIILRQRIDHSKTLLFLFWFSLFKKLTTDIEKRNTFIQSEFTYYSPRLYLKTMFNLGNITENNNKKTGHIKN